jgi:outer membrane protein assembly factor BamB
VRLLDGTPTAAGVRLDGTSPLPPGEHRIEGLAWQALDLTAGLDVPAGALARPTRSLAVRRLRSERLEAAAAPLCLARHPDGHVAIGGRGGDLLLLAPDGSVGWRTAIPGEVLAIALGDLDGDGRPEVLAGGIGCAIHALGPGGRERWVHRPAFGLQYWPWWTLGEPRIYKLEVDDLDADGRPEVLAGVANMRLHCLDADGAERWQFMTEHGIFKTLVTADLDGDGRKEIVGGNDVLSSSSVVRVIGPDGCQLRTYANQGWTAQVRAVLVEDLDGDGRLEGACGTNREQTLRVHAADGSGLRWGHNLGDAVGGLGLLRRPDGNLLVAASRSFYVSAFAPADGRTIWVSNVRHAAASLAIVGERVIVGTEDGRVVALDAAGRILAEAQLGGSSASSSRPTATSWSSARGQASGGWACREADPSRRRSARRSDNTFRAQQTTQESGTDPPAAAERSTRRRSVDRRAVGGRPASRRGTRPHRPR